MTKRDAVAVAGIQARMSSTRLPGKSLMDLGGRPLVHRVWERARACARVAEAVVLTSDEPSDDPLFEACEQAGIPVLRGPLDDVLARYLRLLEEWPSRYVVRVTGDCPFLSPGFVDLQLDALVAHHADHCVLAGGVEAPALAGQGALSAHALQLAATSTDPRDREHVGAFWFAAHRAELRAVEVDVDPVLRDSRLRLAVDEAPDLEFARAVWAEFALEFEPQFDLADLVRRLEERPDLCARHAGVADSAVNRDARAAESASPPNVVGRWP